MDDKTRCAEVKRGKSIVSEVVKLPLEQVQKLRTLIALFNNFIMGQSYSGNDILLAADLMNEAIKTHKELDEKISDITRSN